MREVPADLTLLVIDRIDRSVERRPVQQKGKDYGSNSCVNREPENQLPTSRLARSATASSVRVFGPSTRPR